MNIQCGTYFFQVRRWPVAAVAAAAAAATAALTAANPAAAG